MSSNNPPKCFLIVSKLIVMVNLVKIIGFLDVKLCEIIGNGCVSKLWEEGDLNDMYVYVYTIDFNLLNLRKWLGETDFSILKVLDITDPNILPG